MKLICDSDFISSLKEGDRVLMHSEHEGTRIGHGTVERLSLHRGTASVRLDGDSRPYTFSLNGGRATIGFSFSVEDYSLHRDEDALKCAIQARADICGRMFDNLSAIRGKMISDPKIALAVATIISDEMRVEINNAMKCAGL